MNFLSRPSYIIKHEGRDAVRIIRSKWTRILNIAGGVFFCAAWSFLLSSNMNVSSFAALREQLSEQPYMVFFVLFPVFWLWGIFSELLSLFRRDEFVMSKILGFQKNGKKLSGIREIDFIQIRIINDSEGPDSYRVSVAQKRGQKFPIAVFENKEEAFGIADELAGIPDVQVVKKK